jgi:hypothetical protein
MLGCAIGAVIGAFVLAIAETQSRFFLRGNAPKPDAKPAGFAKCACVLDVAPTPSMPMVIRLTKKLDLTGDSSDGQPRAILYSEGRPTSSMLLSELGLNGSLDATSGDIVLEGKPYLPALIVLAMIIIVAIVGVMVA